MDEETEAPLGDLEAAGDAEDEVLGDGGNSQTQYCGTGGTSSGRISG